MSGLFVDAIKEDPEAQQHVRDWIAALRSGRYEQTGGTLHDDMGFCCLGVACDLIDPTLWVREVRDSGHHGALSWDGMFAGLSDKAARYFGVASDDGSFHQPIRDRTSLASLNDSGRSFAEIADVIENELMEALS